MTAGTSGGKAQDGGGRQLEALRLLWGRDWEFGSTAGEWNARRRDGTGEVLTAENPDGIQSQVAVGYSPFRPVSLPGPCAPRIFGGWHAP